MKKAPTKPRPKTATKAPARKAGAPVVHRPVTTPKKTVTASLDEGYPEFLDAIRFHYGSVGDVPLFRVDTAGLFDGFLANLPKRLRQHYTCHACRNFVEQYGGLVYINPDGTKSSAIWPESVPTIFAESTKTLRAKVSARPITGAFVSAARVYGTPVTGPWSHLSIVPPATRVYKETPAKSAAQREAEIAEDYRLLVAAVGTYSKRHAIAARDLLATAGLYRAEKVLPTAQWFVNILERHPKSHNLLRVAAATAPAGWCHVGSGMLGTVLDDIKAGTPIHVIKRKFGQKMDPLQYLRPTAAPTDGAIDAAERLVEKLGIERSLHRRFARLDEIVSFWRPRAATAPANATTGSFAHLRTGRPAPYVTRQPPMTWAAFCRDALPYCTSLDLDITAVASNFGAMTTAKHADAPPILRWDSVNRRNPFSMYMYRYGSTANQWGLSLAVGRTARVMGISKRPEFWYHESQSGEDGAMLVLEGAKDLWHRAGGGLFPETLRADLHPIRSVVEAHSGRATIAQAAPFGVQNAAGLVIGPGSCNIRITATTASGSRVVYDIDRWG